MTDETVIASGEVLLNGRKVGDVTMGVTLRFDFSRFDPSPAARRARYVEERGEPVVDDGSRPAYIAAIVEDEDGAKRTYAQGADKIVEGIVVDRSVGPALLEEGDA